MSRFGNLEFGSGEEESRSEPSRLKDEDHYLVEAREACENGRFEAALRFYARSIEFNPKLPGAWTGQVRMLIELGEFAEARLWADKALALFPDEPELLAAKGVALGRLGDHAGAISYSDAAVESQASTAYLWLARGDVLLARREKRAEYCFEKALALDPQSWTGLWLASRIHEFHQHFARALKFALDALALAPARAVLWAQAGRCQLALGLAGPAGNSFEQALQLDPNCDVRHLLRAAGETGFLDKLAGRWRQWFRT